MLSRRAPKTSTLEEYHLHVYSGEDSSPIASTKMKSGEKERRRREEGGEKKTSGGNLWNPI